MYLQVSLTEKRVESGKQSIPLDGWITKNHIKRKLRQYVYCNRLKRDESSIAGQTKVTHNAAYSADGGSVSKGDYSTLASGDRSKVDELPGGCLLAEVGEQTTSVNETVDGNREGWGGHRS